MCPKKTLCAILLESWQRLQFNVSLLKWENIYRSLLSHCLVFQFSYVRELVLSSTACRQPHASFNTFLWYRRQRCSIKSWNHRRISVLWFNVSEHILNRNQCTFTMMSLVGQCCPGLKFKMNEITRPMHVHYRPVRLVPPLFNPAAVLVWGSCEVYSQFK